jgi:hypothetical protein
MPTESTTPESQERAIRDAAAKLISTAAQKAGIAIEEVPQYAKDDAYRFARETVEGEARKQSNEYYLLYEQSKAENAALKTQLGVVRENRAAVTDNRVVQTMERTRDLMGRETYFRLSTAQKLSANGIDPASIDRSRLHELFGKNCSTSAAVDLMKVDPFKYRQLREAAKILDITGK